MFEHVENVTVIGDCTRQACGHAMHTRCLVESLAASRGKCLLCNTVNDALGADRGDYNTRRRLREEYTRTLSKCKRNDCVMEGIKDYNAFYSEYAGKRKEFSSRIKQFKEDLRKELGVDRLEKDINTIKKQTRAIFRQSVRESGSIYQHALANLTSWDIDKYLFGTRERWSSWRNRRVFYGVY